VLGVSGCAGQRPKYSHLAAAKKLIRDRGKVDASQLCEAIYAQIVANWDWRMQLAGKKPKIAPALWVLRRRNVLNPKKKGAEVPLERAISNLCAIYEKLNSSEDPVNTWYNQIPVAKGLVSNGEKLNAVDLIFRHPRGKFDFVELKAPAKVGTKTHPLYAGMEALKYGLAFHFFVSNLKEIREEGYLKDGDERLLDASEVCLCVLASKSFYEGFELGWLERQLNDSLTRLPHSSQAKLQSITFRFEVLTNGPADRADVSSGLFGFRRTLLSPGDWARLSEMKIHQ